MDNIMPKGTHEAVVDALIRRRPKEKHLAGETTLVCHAAMSILKGNIFEVESGRRIIQSVFRRNGIPKNKTTIFMNRLLKAGKSRTAEYLMTLKPYSETSTWLITEVS